MIGFPGFSFIQVFTSSIALSGNVEVFHADDGEQHKHSIVHDVGSLLDKCNQLIDCEGSSYDNSITI